MDQAYLKSRLYYNPETGVFVWKPYDKWPLGTQKRFVGKVTGSNTKQGFLTICISREGHFAQNLAWIYMHGVIPDGMKVEHIDGNRTNNEIDNLRLKPIPLANRYKRRIARQKKLIETPPQFGFRVHVKPENRKAYSGVFATQREAFIFAREQRSKIQEELERTA